MKQVPHCKNCDYTQTEYECKKVVRICWHPKAKKKDGYSISSVEYRFHSPQWCPKR